MKIDFLPSEYLINATRDVGGGIESDFLLRALRIKNNSRTPAEIRSISLEIKTEEMRVRTVSYSGRILAIRAKSLVNTVKNLDGHVAQMFLGTKKFWDCGLLSSTSRLGPDQESGLLLEYFRITDKKHPITECAITVSYIKEGVERNARRTIPVTRYESKNDYIFPLKGTWFVLNNYDDIHIHRKMHSQEFGMDLVQLSGEMKIAPTPKSSNEEHACYGRKIFAIADGEVVDSFNDIPENPPGLGSRLPDEEWEDIRKRFGFVPGIAGNYVILKHKGNEYSFYAHMIPGSVTAKRGEKLKQGQVLGRLGNSGNSDAPHLHFHLMAGPNILSARGLPCRFTNLTHALGDEPLGFITETNSIVNAE